MLVALTLASVGAGGWRNVMADGVVPVRAAESVTPPSAPPAPVTAAAPPVAVPPSGCGALDTVVVASGPGAAVSICRGDGGLVYHGRRAIDGASITVPATQEGSTWVAPHDDVTYLVGDEELLVMRSGTTVDKQRFDAWWVRQV